MDNKGVFYSLGLTLIAILLLTLAVLVNTQNGFMESRQIELSYLHKISDIDSSTNYAFSKLLISESPTRVSASNNSLNIYESFPLNLNNTDSALSNLASSIESDFRQINISTDLFLEKHGFMTLNTNITYEHQNNKGMYILPNNNITDHDLTIITQSNITSCVTDTNSGGSISMTFLADSPGSDCQFTESNLLKANISLMIGPDELNINVDDSGYLHLETISGNPTFQTNTTISFTNNANKTKVLVPILLETQDNLYNFSKNSYVILRLPN